MTFEEYSLHIPSLKKVEKKVNDLISAFKDAKSSDEALKIIKKFNKFSDDLQTDFVIISIRYSLNTNDPVYQKAQKKVDEISPLISNVVNEWNKLLSTCKYRSDLEEKLGKYYFQMIDNALKAFDEKIIPEMIEENKLSSEYDRILGSAQINFNGEVLNLSQMGKYTTSSDRKIRHDANVAIDAWMGEHEQAIGDIYDKLVKLRHQMAIKLGYKNYIELGYLKLGRCDYDAEMVKNYRHQIAECVVPICQKLYKKQAQRLNIKFNDMAAYDYNCSFLDGNPKPAGDADYLVATATNMYDDMSSESSQFFHFMLKNHLMDLLAKPGKYPGGYMTYMPRYKAPFIFANFNGTEGDVNVLTHEVGHAFQGYLAKDIKIPEFRSPTLEACEIHSMSMEFFAWPYMKDFFKDDEKKYLYSHLESAIEFLPYGITIDEFQHWVYENPNATHNERCAKFHEIESKYTPHKIWKDTPTFAHGGYWLRQSHIFGTPFYYIDYTLAQVCALQFLVEMQKNKEKAWKKYIKLCKCGGKYPFVALLEKNHIRNPFIDGNVAKTIKPVVKILNQIGF